jgi:hypothetical protein
MTAATTLMSKSHKKPRAKKASHSKADSSKVQVQETTETQERRKTGAVWHASLVISLLALMAAQMVWMAHAKSVTMDEPNHITRGIVYLRTGDLRLNHLHPPLINLMCAIPLLAMKGLVLPLNHASWQAADLDHFADQFLWSANKNGHSIVFRARLVIVVLTLCLGLTVYAWSREMFGPAAGVLGLALFAFDPNMMAHGSLATNDMGVTLFAGLTLYTFWRWLKKPTRGRAVVAAIAFCLAQVSKYSALLLVPSLVVIGVVYWFMLPPEQRPSVRPLRILGWLGVIALIGAVVVWAVYGFKMGAINGRGPSLPASAYFEEIKAAIKRVGQGNATFLLGSYSRTGWWYYFPVAFAVKTPITTMLLVGAALVYSWRRSETWRGSLVLLIPFVVHFGLSIASSFNIGYRHLLPALVPVLVFASQLAPAGFDIRSKFHWAGAFLVVWLVFGTLSNFPDHLAYFNEIAGGPSQGYKVLTDSNLDWGQDLIGLRKYMIREGIPTVNLSYFGIADPKAYGVECEILPSYPRYIWRNPGFPPFLIQPAPGVYAISATNLEGTLFENHNLYAWFRERKPDAAIGHSIFVYTVRGP